MYNWSVDEKRFKKENPKAYKLWRFEQLNFLEFIQKEPQITKRFYWTGGTALSEVYLKHRLSEDIDLFNEIEEVDQTLIDGFLKKISIPLKIIAN